MHCNVNDTVKIFLRGRDPLLSLDYERYKAVVRDYVIQKKILNVISSTPILEIQALKCPKTFWTDGKIPIISS